ncbi:sugar ABC transporter permease YjfF [candidate division KSB3 bacterium]|uniref:Sugar ABC transporter permease YjfF n=1 Tax=candidate division KSB3 bacterium TaxID=2044937 RepID=A0A2G6E509_9BACT|nr:MAG: sugar ABC transporter permease YjfF [candidate division KSB3 bacterium]PIE29505.1 MAG: sugar ABC transporter permease YjfF [candidate division KSB3 bacterium]
MQTNHQTGFKKASFLRKNLTIVAPLLVFAVFFLIGGVMFKRFFTLRVLFNLFTDNAFVGLVAVGMTVVIISGGIDLSVGSIVSTTAMMIAVMDRAGISPLLVIPLALSFGTILGFLQGVMIQHFDVEPFIVTLTGMFLARGLGFVLSLSSIPIDGTFYRRLSRTSLRFGKGGTGILASFPTARLTTPAILFLLMVLLTWFLLRYTRFGRRVYALGGSERSAFLMGVPVAKTKILIYTFSGFCAGLGGFAYSLYMLAGYGRAAIGLELEAIASVVIGGTLLTGGSGSVFGTLIGVCIRGMIQTFISFQGRLNVYWTPIFIGSMLFLFIVMQKLFLAAGAGRKR